MNTLVLHDEKIEKAERERERWEEEEEDVELFDGV